MWACQDQDAQAIEITRPYGRRCLDLNSGNEAVIALQYNTDFAHLMVAEMIGRKAQIGRRRKL